MEKPAVVLVPDLKLPLPGERVFISKTLPLLEAGAARWTGNEWAYFVRLENDDHAWIIENKKESGWLEIPEPERLTAPADGPNGPLS